MWLRFKQWWATVEMADRRRRRRLEFQMTGPTHHDEIHYLARRIG